MDCWIWTPVCITETVFASPFPLLLSKTLCVNVIVSICNSNTPHPTTPPHSLSLSALLIFLFFRPLSLHSLLARSLFHLLRTLSLCPRSSSAFVIHFLSLYHTHTHTHTRESYQACIKCELASPYTSLSFRLHCSVYII